MRPCYNFFNLSFFIFFLLPHINFHRFVGSICTNDILFMRISQSGKLILKTIFVEDSVRFYVRDEEPHYNLCFVTK